VNFFEIQAGLLCFAAKQFKSSINSDEIIYSYIIVEAIRVGFVEKLKDILMPIEDVMEDEYTEEEVPEVQEEAVVRERQVVNGSPVGYAAAPATPVRPQLTVHTTKVPELKIQIYVPQNFDQVTTVADDLKAKKAAVVNYERVESVDQRRICDFLNGVCYVTDGEVKRISETMVLYVPAGVSISEATPTAMPE
jgi:cell division inhibitor SepF